MAAHASALWSKFNSLYYFPFVRSHFVSLHEVSLTAPLSGSSRGPENCIPA